MGDKPHSKFQHVYAVVRFDFPVDQDRPENSVMVVKVFRSEDAADQEMFRLNKLNAAKGSRYEVRTSRLVP